MKKTWYEAPKDKNGWPLWLPRLTAKDMRERTLGAWVYDVFWGTGKLRQVCDKIEAMRRTNASKYCRTYFGLSATWNRMCRELGYTETHYV